MKNLIFALIIAFFPLASSAETLNFVNTHLELENVVVSGLSTGYSIIDTGYYHAGDMPAVKYTLQTSNCTLDSGAGDGGSQFPSMTSGYCWYLAPQTEYDVRTWGAVAGGGEPGSGADNAGRINLAIAYVGSLNPPNIYLAPPYHSLIVPLAMTPLTGGGLLYAIKEPINLNVDLYRFYGFSFVADPATTVALPCNEGLLEITEPVTMAIDHVQVDADGQANNGLLVAADGTIHVDNLIVRHWAGECSNISPVTITGTTTAGSRVVSVPSGTTGLFTGMVLRGSSYAPNLSVITSVASNSITISAVASSSGSSSLTFNNDVSGIVFGIPNANGSTLESAGGTYSNINSYEWDGTADSMESGNPAYRFGYAVDCTGASTSHKGCNDIALEHGLLESGIAPLFVDSHAGGIKATDLEINNSDWSTPQTNPACILLAGDALTITLSDSSENGCSTQVNITDSSRSKVILSGMKFTSSGSSILSPNSLLQIWTDQSNADASGISLDSFSSNLSIAPWALINDPSSGSFSQTPNNVQYSGAVLNYTEGDETYTSGSSTVSYGDCGYAILVNNGSSSATITLPAAITGINTSNSCSIKIFVTGTGPVSLTPASGASLNGSSSAMSLNENQGYIVWSTVASSSSSIAWALAN